MNAPERLRTAGRLAAIAATALALLATSVPTCVPEDRGEFDVETTCGAPGVVTLAFEGASWASGCGGADCWAFVEAGGANAVGLPEQGEIHPAPDPNQESRLTASAPPGTALASLPFALVGAAPVAGASPPAMVRRVCRASPTSTVGVVNVTCDGDEAGAACAGTLTLRPVAP